MFISNISIDGLPFCFEDWLLSIIDAGDAQQLRYFEARFGDRRRRLAESFARPMEPRAGPKLAKLAPTVMPESAAKVVTTWWPYGG